jgi:hypothetical protein
MSTFNKLGFDHLFIKGVLFNVADFIGEKGDDQTSSTKGPNGNAGANDGFEFNTINTTATTTVITLPDPAIVSYDGIIVKCNGILTSATEQVGTLQIVRIKTYTNETLAVLYNNSMPQTVRLTKVHIPSISSNGDFAGYLRWDI